MGGGAGRSLHLLCRELHRRGLGLRVWTGDPGPGRRPRHEFAVDYVRARRRPRYQTSLRALAAYALRVAVRAFRLAPGGRPCLVFSAMGIPAGVAGALISRRLGVPHVVWYHGSDVHGGRPGGCGRLQRRLLRWVFRGAAANLFVSPGLRALAESYGRVPNPAILPPCPSPEALAADPLGGAPQSQRYFLFLGRLEPVKNPALLVEAAALLKREGCPRRIRVVGEGALGPELARRIRLGALSGHVSLEAAVPAERVPDLLRSAYALVLPSRVEGFNTTALEAAHFGVPAVGSDAPGIRDFVRHGETGVLFPENDAGALAEALRALDRDPARRDDLGRRAREAARPYRESGMADAFLARLREASLLPAGPAEPLP